MTLTAIQKAEIDRGIVLVEVGLLERKIASNATTPLTISAVRAHLGIVENIKKSLLEVHSRIAYQQPTDMAPHEIEYTAIIERLTKSTIELQDIQNSLTASSSSSTTPPPVPVHSTTHVKLPEMQLPSFEGRFEEWPSFDDLFQATIGKNVSLAKAQKLQYLKSCVKGEAYNLIKSFVITDQNYDEAWTLLSSRYNNQSEIVYSLCKKILYQSQVKGESVTSLQQLLNSTTEAIRSLRVMGQPTDTWGSLLVVSTIEKLDPETKSAWAKTRTGTTPATFKKVTEFLELQIRSLIAKGALTTKVISATTTNNNNRGNNQVSTKARTYHISSAPALCPLCKGSHQLYQCPKLLEMDASQRMSAVRKTSACLNCLRGGHPVKKCISTHTCKHCSRRHHTLLHSNDAYQTHQQEITTSNSTSSSTADRVVRTNISAASTSSSQRVFKTAMVDIEDSQGIRRQCRVLFDDCSEAEYITESCAKALGLPTRKENVLVEGVGQVKVARVKSSASATLHSRVSGESIFVENMLVLPRLSGYIPRLPCDSQEWNHIHGLPLADPTYDKPGEIDILLGTGVVSYLMKDGISRGTPNQPVAYNSSFGWVLSGIMNAQPLRVVRTHHTTCKLEELVQRFWEVEQIPLKKPLTNEEQAAENHFMETHTRKADGRFVVRLPFNEKKAEIGETREQAMRRLFQLEKRFKKFPKIKEQYVQFMREYEDLGHMQRVTKAAAGKKRVFIPHHFVQKEDSTTTKLRVVFDASMKSTSGVSLNDALMVGPTIQDDLYTQTNRFRTHLIALKADLAKMYRQFEVHEDEWNYQVILWRESEEDPVQEFWLKTVTYGTACAPFLATRCLDQLSTDGKHQYPLAALIIKQMMYIDDLLGGQNTKQDALQLFNELVELCKKGGLDIRKWCSSDQDVLRAIPEEMQEQALVHDFDEDTTVKALGIRWRPQGDYFYFHVEQKSPKDIITKREILSEIARTFDPIGWLTPTTVVAKILFQDLWKETADWDAQVSDEIKTRWNAYCQELQVITRIQIPRLIIPEHPVDIQIHCFADSSEKAMACALYMRCVKKNGEITSHLITSKSRIAPIKQLSIPRLELNAAVLLVETFDAVVKSYNFQYTVYAWTDSMITLSWLTSPSRRWKTYVATRVATIQEIIPARCWNHVRSNDNPADLPSRGISPEELVNSAIWWHGPPWLISNNFPISQAVTNEEEVAKEERTTKTTLFISTSQDTLDALFQVSSLIKVVTRTAWLRRFIMFLKGKQKCQIGPICATERREALNVLIAFVQQQSFGEEINALRKNKQLSSKSKLLQLNPFIDSSGVIRVGGRIGNADMSSAIKYPIILPHHHQLTILIIRQCHHDTLHGGFTLTLSLLRRQYWILRGRDTVRHILRKCVTCKRVKATNSQQFMGNLPASRVAANRPFYVSGVDFAGPFAVRMKKGRGVRTEKVYMAVFVCFSTKAVHLEAVVNLSTADFIACYRRFSARRGIPKEIHSDCGTNFVGAAKELQRMTREMDPHIQQHLSSQGTRWIFNPPSAPHQGGLWEAAVKSAKYHLKRVIGSHILTFDQFNTLLANVEACLNSRPLAPLSSDPLDTDALTPGHFLVGGPLLAVPDDDLTEIPDNRLEHWQRVQQITQHFWKRWQNEYLVTLQPRQKWNKKERNIAVGDLVIIRDEVQPPTKWKLGRVIAVQPGNDGLVRRATVRTATGELIRPIIKLSLILPCNEC